MSGLPAATAAADAVTAADTPPERDRLATTLFIALLLHGILILGITFGRPQASQGMAPTLDVQLVVDTLDEPRSGEAAYIAEVDRQGRGTTTDRVPKSTPRGVAPRPLTDEGPLDPGVSDPDGRSIPPSVLATRVPRITVLYAGPVAPQPLAPGKDRPERSTSPATPLTERGGEDRVDRAQLTGPLAAEGERLAPDASAAVIAPWLEAWRR